MQAFISIVDRIIELAKRGEERRHRELKEVVEPLFKELEMVVQDYFELFRQARDLLAEPGKRDDVCKLIRSRREEMLLARIRVRKMTEGLSNDQRFAEFSNAIRDLFYSTTWPAQQASRGEILCDLFDYIDAHSICGVAERMLTTYWVSKNKYTYSRRLHFFTTGEYIDTLQFTKNDGTESYVCDTRGDDEKWLKKSLSHYGLHDYLEREGLKSFGENDADFIQQFVEGTLINTERNWAEICGRYSDLRTELLSGQSIFKKKR